MAKPAGEKSGGSGGGGTGKTGAGLPSKQRGKKSGKGRENLPPKNPPKQ
jgi:hypothetical protein